MTLEQARAYLRLESSGEDALVARLVASATALAEAYLGMALVRRTVVETLAAGEAGAWRRLGSAPVAAIVRVARIAVDGSAAMLGADDYAIDIDARGEGWVRAAGGGRLRVTYTAGLAEVLEEVPAPIAQGVIRLAAHLYARRDDMSGPPAAVAALWRPYRRLRLGLETAPELGA
jgi:uncharacterized phiE125 gp8 family phage protein